MTQTSTTTCPLCGSIVEGGLRSRHEIHHRELVKLKERQDEIAPASKPSGPPSKPLMAIGDGPVLGEF
ncbi:hypothetical protein ABKW28_11715 [Nocardioides sp. 31GB23]|uniref:hypothetical protein n=1 Tax=Nocardioides sp. 31GB23 TaxID=3156065 RepID=UPI0032AF947A